MARGVTDRDLEPWKATFLTPKALAEKVVAADKVVTT